MKAGRTELLLNAIILALEDLIIRAPFTTELVTIEPVVRKLIAKALESLLPACAELDHRTPCFRLLL
jgi:hypothetical protein